MSCATLDVINERIKHAPIDSPIAVFKPSSRDDINMRRLNAVFASTIETKRMQRDYPYLFVGMFHKGMDFSLVQGVLRSALK